MAEKAAGYSGTPLPQKLGIKEAHNVVVLGAPSGFGKVLGDLPMGAHLSKKLDAKLVYDVIVVFVKTRADLERRVVELSSYMTKAAGLWIAWPKKSSGVVTDVTEQTIRDVALPTGLVDNKVCAIDETWSGLRLVIRRENR